MLEILFKNPITIWLRWLFLCLTTQVKYPGRKIQLEYLCEIHRTTFSTNNTIRKYSRIRDVQIGKFSYVGRNSQVYHASIGNFSCIGPEVIIGPGEHPTNLISSHPIFYSTIGQSNPVIVDRNSFEEFPQTTIGNDVWIGARAILKTGITVGDGAIIAAGAVVVNDVAAFSIVGGVPAKLIRQRFNETQQKCIVQSDWWNKDLHWLKTNKDLFLDTDRFVEQMSSSKT